MQRVWVFQGYGSRFANAVFSTRGRAEAWIAQHLLTGLLTGYELDAPAFDRGCGDGTLPRDVRDPILRGEPAAPHIERYVDGSSHAHFFYGLSENAPGFLDALERWHREHPESEA